MKANEFRGIRERAGLSKSGVARLLGKTYRTVHRWEDEDASAMSQADVIVMEMLDAGELPARYLEGMKA